MTTDDLITRARAEAEARWPIPTDPKTPVQWHDIGMASGFVLGALWHAAQQPTREQIAEVLCVQWFAPSWERATSGAQGQCLRVADRALALFDGADR